MRLCKQLSTQEDDADDEAPPILRYVWIDCLCLSLPLLAGHYNPSMVEAGSPERAAREEPESASKAAALGAAREVFMYTAPDYDAVPLTGRCTLVEGMEFPVEMFFVSPWVGADGVADYTMTLGMARLKELEG